jgi:hypothetical protein
MGAAEDLEGRTGEQALLRQANDRVLGLSERDPVDVAEFVCECGGRGCATPILVTLREYAEIRADPTLVIVAPDHLPAAHELVYRCPGYVVMQRSAVH